MWKTGLGMGTKGNWEIDWGEMKKGMQGHYNDVIYYYSICAQVNNRAWVSTVGVLPSQDLPPALLPGAPHPSAGDEGIVGGW